MNGEIQTTLGDGTPVVFTEGAWEAVGDMLRERELDRDYSPEMMAAMAQLADAPVGTSIELTDGTRLTVKTIYGQDPNLPGPTH